jgi:hypothetical protein
MGARQSIINLKPFASVCPERRRLNYSLVMAVLVIAASAATLWAQGEIRIPLHAFMPPDFPATVNEVIPTPQYLPAGYELWRIYKIPAAGSRTGKSYVEVQYRDPGCWERKINCSFQVFVSPRTGRTISGPTGSAPESLSLRIRNRTVQAQYFKSVGTDLQPWTNPLPGEQGARQEASNYNALVFRLDAFIIGIRADSQARLSRAELIKVAESLKYKAR